MKNLFKILTLIMVFMFSVNCSFAFSVGKLEKLIKKSNLNQTATMAISIKNADTGSVVYEQNQNKLLHPASTLKVFTTYASIDALGSDYFFKTQFYKDSQNNLYIKLGADPLLTSSQLEDAFQKIKEAGNINFENLYIDDSVIDKKEFASGWMWDDDVNPNTPKVSSYNLDNNVVQVFMTNNPNGFVSTSLKTTYPMSVISVVKTGSQEDYLEVNRYNWMNPELVEIYGNIKAVKPIVVPISSMRRYYIHNVDKSLENNKISITNTKYASRIVPENAELLTVISNPMLATVSSILQNSNNLMSESIFKLAAAVKYNATGTDILGEEMFKEFYKKQGLDIKNIAIKDGCGVSRYNLMYADWMTQALNKIYKMKNFEQYRDFMAQAGDGTLATRLHDLRGEAWLKTGSLTNVSTITGYIKSQDGHTYSVAIMIQNFVDEQSEIKKFEDEIINIIYNR